MHGPTRSGRRGDARPAAPTPTASTPIGRMWNAAVRRSTGSHEGASNPAAPWPDPGPANRSGPAGPRFARESNPRRSPVRSGRRCGWNTRRRPCASGYSRTSCRWPWRHRAERPDPPGPPPPVVGVLGGALRRGSTGSRRRPTARSATGTIPTGRRATNDRTPASRCSRGSAPSWAGVPRARPAASGCGTARRFGSTGPSAIHARTSPADPDPGDPGVRTRRRHPAGDRRSPTSRYEVATGVRIGRGGAPGSSATSAGADRASVAARCHSPSIPRAVASGSSNCGT